MTDKENLKKMNQIYIQTQTLVEFIKKNEVAWQMYDSLIEFSQTEGNVFTADVEGHNECQSKHNFDNNFIQYIRSDKTGHWEVIQ